MKINESNFIAGMSIGGGKKEHLFFCILEFFEKEKRWFLTSLKDIKEETVLSQDEIITQWVAKSDLQHLIVDFPLTKPTCEGCKLICPGVDDCKDSTIVEVRKQMHELLTEDQRLVRQNPKKYEQERNEDDEVQYSRSILYKETTDHILSKSFNSVL